MSWPRNLREWFGCSSTEQFRAVASKVCIVIMIANHLKKEDDQHMVEQLFAMITLQIIVTV